MYKKPLILIIASFVLLSANVYSKDISIDNKSLYSIESLKNNANQAVTDKNYKKAVFLFGQLVKKFPKDEELRIKLAYSLFMNNDYKEAVIQFDKIVRTSKNPNYTGYAQKQLNIISEMSKTNKVATKVITKDIKDNKIIEIEDKEKEYYLCNKGAPTFLEDGRFMRWEKPDLPIKVYIPAVPESFNVKETDKYISIVKYSMQKWSERAPKFISFKFVKDFSDANIKINWIESFKDESTWGLASRPAYIKEMQKRESTIYLPVKAQAGTASYTNDAVLFSEDELSALIIHETGHALGLGHSYSDPNNVDIMAPNYHITLPGVKPQLTPRDVKSLLVLYSLPEGAVCSCKPAGNSEDK